MRKAVQSSSFLRLLSSPKLGSLSVERPLGIGGTRSTGECNTSVENDFGIFTDFVGLGVVELISMLFGLLDFLMRSVFLLGDGFVS